MTNNLDRMTNWNEVTAQDWFVLLVWFGFLFLLALIKSFTTEEQSRTLEED